MLLGKSQAPRYSERERVVSCPVSSHAHRVRGGLMSRGSVATAFLATIVASSAVAQTQEKGLGPYVFFRLYPKQQLLRLPTVQEELKLTADQKARLAKIEEKDKADY